MAFNNWPYSNFQDLNLGWIIATYKNALNKALEALGKANAVEAEVDTYSDRIETAETNASGAYAIANLAREEAANAQSDATSGIAIGQAAQSTANSALSAANAAADSADAAVDSATDAARDAATALQLANVASEDYLNVGITVFPSNPVQATKNADEILTAVTANKKIKFTLDDSRTGDTHTTYDYTIDPVANTASDININVIFDVSVSSSLNKYIIVTFHKVVSGGNTTYSITSTDVSFSGGGGGTVSGAVLYDTVQNLTTAQKTQARDNIGAIDGMTNIPITLSNGVYSTTMTAAEILNHLVTNGCCISWNGLYFYPAGGTYSGPFGALYFECVWPASSQKAAVSVFQLNMNGGDAAPTIQRYARDININGSQPYIQVANAVTYNLPSNTLVEFTGDSTALSISLATATDTDITHEYHFIFHSGSTPTTLTLPNTVRQPDGFTVEANHVYEVSILENNMLAYGWAVTP